MLCKIKKTNKICSDLKISESINAESAYDRKNKSMYSYFNECKKIRSCLIKREEKTVSGQLPPEENCPPVRIGVRVSFMVGGQPDYCPRGK